MYRIQESSKLAEQQDNLRTCFFIFMQPYTQHTCHHMIPLKKGILHSYLTTWKIIDNIKAELFEYLN